MGKKRARPLPVAPPPVKSRKRARKIITTYHQIQEGLARVQGNGSEERAFRAKLNLLGGTQAYQSASLLSVSFHNTSKWCTQLLTKIGLRPCKGEPPLRTLEVGAINPRLLRIPWLEVRAVDLKSQHPDIEEIDFFDLPQRGDYDVLVSSMVLNCVPTPERRGDMLRGYRAMLREGGHLFLMLPLLCLTHSRAMDRGAFNALLERVGFELVETKNSPKVAFFCAKAVPLATTAKQASREQHARHGQEPQEPKAQESKARKKKGKGKSGRNDDFDIVLS